MSNREYGPTRSPRISVEEEDKPDEVDAAAQPRCNQWAHIDLNLSRNLTPAERRITLREERRWSSCAGILWTLSPNVRAIQRFEIQVKYSVPHPPPISGFNKVIKFRQTCVHAFVRIVWIFILILKYKFLMFISRALDGFYIQKPCAM